MTKSGKHCGKRRNCSFWAIFPFVTMFSKSRLLQRHRKASIWGKELRAKLRGEIECKLSCGCTRLRQSGLPVSRSVCKAPASRKGLINVSSLSPTHVFHDFLTPVLHTTDFKSNWLLFHIDCLPILKDEWKLQCSEWQPFSIITDSL